MNHSSKTLASRIAGKPARRSALASTVILAASLWLIAVGCEASSVAEAPSPTNTPRPTNTPTTPISVGALELIEAYDGNPVAADATYKDKVGLISGEILAISEAGNGFDVKLTGPGFHLADVVCKVGSVEDVLALQAGQDVTVRGRIVGVTGVFDIVVEDCRPVG